jgi:two-component system nitrogen regulation response regulator GlnG
MRRNESTVQTHDGMMTPAKSKSGAVVVVMLTVLHHPDPARVGDRAALVELVAGREVLLSRDIPQLSSPSGDSLRPLEDACVSRTPLLISPLKDGGIRVQRGESRTKLVFRNSAVEHALELSAADLDRGAVVLVGGRIALLLHRVEITDLPGGDDLGLVGESAGILRVRREVRWVADLEIPVLIRGETGTGKDLVARAIHKASARRDAPFVAVNLAAIPSTLASAELFGAERGSFTGAVQGRPGYFNVARGGTLFLDEIGDAPSDVQVMLLRAIETGEAQAIGAGRARQSDVRIVAATDADLEAKVRDGSFRAPLLHRLSSYEIRMPPLRQRRDDIGRLLMSFLREELEQIGESHRLSAPTSDSKSWLPASLVARLADLDWAGNVRQLRNVARQLVISSRGRDRVEVGPAVERLLDDPNAPRAADAPGSPAKEAVKEAEAPAAPAAAPRRKPADISEAELEAALRKSRWDLAAAANELGIPRASVYVIIQRGGRFRTAGDLSAAEISQCHRACGGDVERMVEQLEVSEKALRRRIREIGLSDPADPSAKPSRST